MIKLKGQIRVPKLQGTIYKIAGEGSGGPLQAKTVYPSHSEQIIAPDEDYYGLVSVTVKPVPRVPAVGVGITEGVVAADVETVVNIGVSVSVIAEDYVPPATHAFYNEVRLPLIPEEVLSQYPYAWIRNNSTTGYYDLLLSDAPFYYLPSESSVKEGTLTAGKPWYRAEIATADTATEWTDNTGLHTYDGWGLDSARTVLWSNHDIPNGSADATDIYFEGTEPVPVD